MGWSGSASIGYYAVGNFYQNHPLANSATANTIACVNSPTSMWSNVVYQLNFIHPGNVIHITVIYHTVVHKQLKSCVEWGSTNTGWHINVYYVKFPTHTSNVKLEHNGIWGWVINGVNGWGIHGLNWWGIHSLNWWGLHGLNGWDIYGLNGWDIYGSNGWDTYGKVSYRYRFLGDIKKTLVFREVLFPVIAWVWRDRNLCDDQKEYSPV